MTIRTLQPDEAELFRELRLRALTESPNAFGETLQQAKAQPESYWQKLTESVTQPGGQVMVLVEHAEHIAGFAFGLFDRQDSHVGHLGGMWVDPAFRSNGIGYRLVDAIVAWAGQRHKHRLELWVTEGNHAAIRLYERCGFVETGRRDLLPSRPGLQVIQMAIAPSKPNPLATELIDSGLFV